MVLKVTNCATYPTYIHPHRRFIGGYWRICVYKLSWNIIVYSYIYIYKYIYKYILYIWIYIYIYNKKYISTNLNWGGIFKWFFCNEPTPFSKTPAFKSESSSNPPKGHSCLELYLSLVEKELFELPVSHLGYSNFTKKEWTAIRSYLAHDCCIIIKRFLCSSLRQKWLYSWSRKTLVDGDIHQDFNFVDRILHDLVDKSNEMFRSLKSQGKITEKELKYFTYEYQNATNLGKIYLLLKIHKILHWFKKNICCGNLRKHQFSV